MLTKGLLLAVVLSAAILALPVAAFAQSAGDDQYADPFGPVEQQDDSRSGNEQPPPVQGQTEGSAPEDLEPMDALPAAPEATAAQTGVGGDTLPRTGFEAWLFGAIGWWMLLGGIALRRITAT